VLPINGEMMKKKQGKKVKEKKRDYQLKKLKALKLLKQKNNRLKS
jgi:hypothetical protein